MVTVVADLDELCGFGGVLEREQAPLDQEEVFDFADEADVSGHPGGGGVLAS